MSNLYHLKDELGWFHNLIYICGEPCTSKNLQEKEAVIYTEIQMEAAKAFFARKRIRVHKCEVTIKKTGPVGKTWKKKEKI